MVNRRAEVIAVGQVNTLINFYPNMVRFRIWHDFFGLFFFFIFLLLFLYFSFQFFSFVVIAAVQTEFKTMCYFGNMSLSYAFQCNIEISE